ncbi:priA [Acrasis kona]|uniref:PriA n=1 Tax=Acrasis kona TaxID=1008807 RepID=A0AAW2ZFQ2_9EUKA
MIHHYRALQSNKDCYVAPWIVQPMMLNPPPNGPFRTPIPGEIILPSDKYKAQIERYSAFGQELSSSGLAHDFAAREIDRAAARVKELMRQDDTLKLREAIKIFDREYDHEKRMQKREKELLREDAIRNGEVFTVLDSFQLLKLIKDAQREQLLGRDEKLEKALEIALNRREEVKKNLTESQINVLEQTNVRATEDDYEEAEGSDDEVDLPNRLLPFERINFPSQEILKLTTHHLRKRIYLSKKIIEVVKDIHEFRFSEKKMDPKYSPHILDFLYAYMKAYNINTSKDDAKDTRNKSGIWRHSVRLFTYEFEKYKHAASVDLDTSGTLERIGLPQKVKRSIAAEEAILRKGVKKPDFGYILTALEGKPHIRHDELKADLKFIESVFFDYQLSLILGPYLESSFKMTHRVETVSKEEEETDRKLKGEDEKQKILRRIDKVEGMRDVMQHILSQHRLGVNTSLKDAYQVRGINY